MSSNNLISFDTIQKSLMVVKQKRPDFPVEHTRLVRLIANVHQRTVDVYNDLLKQFDLSYRTYSALMTIYTAGEEGITPSELAAAMGEKRSNITRLSDELLQLELIIRDTATNDRRNIDLRISSQGEALLDRLAPRIKELLTALYAPLSRKQLDALESSLYQQLQVLVAMHHVPDPD